MNHFELLKNILGNKIDVSNLKEDDLLLDLGLDSLDLVETALAIEEALKIEFTADEIASLNTIRDVLQIIKRKTK
jgi:acyl carrier protein